MITVLVPQFRLDPNAPARALRVGGSGIIRPCCADPKNLVDPSEAGEEVVRRTCQVCGRNHYRALHRPGHIGMRLGR